MYYWCWVNIEEEMCKQYRRKDGQWRQGCDNNQGSLFMRSSSSSSSRETGHWLGQEWKQQSREALRADSNVLLYLQSKCVGKEIFFCKSWNVKTKYDSNRTSHCWRSFIRSDSLNWIRLQCCQVSLNFIQTVSYHLSHRLSPACWFFAETRDSEATQQHFSSSSSLSLTWFTLPWFFL